MRYSPEKLDIAMTPFSLRSPSGERIVGCLDTVRQARGDEPLVVIPPAFGRTMRDSVALSWYLLAHGHRVVRFDNVCSEGVSDGSILDFTLSRTIADLNAVLGFVRDELRPARLGVVAVSLSFRSAARALVGSREIGLLFALVGTPCVRRTIAAAVGFDAFNVVERDGTLAPTYVIDGHEVRAREFVVDAVGAGLDDLAGTREDLARCPFPVVAVAGEEDGWVDSEDVKLVLAPPEAGGSVAREVLLLPGVSHHLGRNPVATALALQEMVVWCMRTLQGVEPTGEDVRHPTITELVRVRNETSYERLGLLSDDPERFGS